MELCRRHALAVFDVVLFNMSPVFVGKRDLYFGEKKKKSLTSQPAAAHRNPLVSSLPPTSFSHHTRRTPRFHSTWPPRTPARSPVRQRCSLLRRPASSI